MIDNIDNAYLNGAIKELVDLFGVAEHINQDEYATLVKQKDYSSCIAKIAQHYKLPVKFNITMVPKGYKASTKYYTSSGLVKTDNQGKGTSGITAQIQLPADLPLFGDPRMKDVTISVVVGEECSETPDTFVSIMAHEVAHLLLATLRHPKKDNEFYTDLVPLVLGFSEVVKHGRSIKEQIYEAHDSYTERTTTYGYLNDRQFGYSANRINSILLRFRDRRNRLIILSEEAGIKIKKLRVEIKKRSLLLEDLPKYSKKLISLDDSKAIVNLYGNSSMHEYELMIKQADMVRNQIHEAYDDIRHYTKIVGKQMNEAESLLKKTNSLLSSALSKMATDINILSRNLSLLHRLSRFLR